MCASPLHAMQAQRVAILARHADDLCMEIAAARVLGAFNQNRPVSFEDVAMIELLPPASMDETSD
jgi:hypothetical protein